MAYPNLWLANPSYTLAEKIAFSHQDEAFTDDQNERIATWVLIKGDPYLTLPHKK